MNNLVCYVKWLVSNIYGHYTIYEKNPNSFPTSAYIYVGIVIISILYNSHTDPEHSKNWDF